jgi:CBS domain-containing protein
MKVAEILKQKSEGVISVRRSEPIERLSHRLRMARIGAMVVLGEDGALEGIISERDVVHGIAEHGAACLELTVADLMTTRVVTCTPEDSISRIAKIMTESRIRHLPVIEGHKLVGVVSVGDVVKNRMEEMSLEASVLRDIAIAGH